MKKYLVTIEFRYTDAPTDEHDSGYRTKIITIGVYDTQDDAITNGNRALEIFEKYFPLNPYWNVKERFSKNGGCFGSFENLITNISWITTPFSLYAKITELDYQDVEETINNVLSSIKKYNEYKIRNKDNEDF